MDIQITEKNLRWRYLLWDRELYNKRNKALNPGVKYLIRNIDENIDYINKYDYIIYKGYVAFIFSPEHTTYIYTMDYITQRQVKLDNYRVLVLK